MDSAEEKKENYMQLDNSLCWVAGTVITAALPFFVMLVGWIAGDYSKSISLYYVGIADSAAFMYSVSLCLLLLCLDFDKKIEKKNRTRGAVLSIICVIFSAALYCVTTISDIEGKIKLELTDLKELDSEELIVLITQQKEKTNLLISGSIVIITFVMVMKGYCINKKHEKIIEEEKKGKYGDKKSKDVNKAKKA